MVFICLQYFLNKFSHLEIASFEAKKAVKKIGKVSLSFLSQAIAMP
jgi:hypothetical protein